ncbi:MAG: DUF3604 domain-containing protein [Acidobacteria bacterium]|nr:DUF3604 domain-containing protein [Acidobacteriota bacterium]
MNPRPRIPAGILAAALMLGFGLAISEVAVSPARPGSAEDNPGVSMPQESFQITFGVKDAVPQQWDGKVDEDAGGVFVEADHFRNHEYLSTTFSAQGVGRAGRGEPRFSNDRLTSSSSWIASTREAPLHGLTTEWNVRTEAPKSILQSPSILVHRKPGMPSLPIRVRTVRGDFEVSPEALRPFMPRLFLDGNVRVDRIPPAAAVSAGRLNQQDFPSILAARSGAIVVAWQEYEEPAGDLVCVRRMVNGAWQPVEKLTQGSDIFRVVLAEDSSQRIWAVWSMQVDGNWDLYGRWTAGEAWSPIERLTRDSGTDLYQQAATDVQGRMWLVWQRISVKGSAILASRFDGTRWSEEQEIGGVDSAGGNCWWPAVARGTEGIVVAWDGYGAGNYDIYLRRHDGERWGAVERITSSPLFEAHPAVAVDGAGRIWLAWDESGPEWGKDTGFLVVRKGTQLHESRAIRVVRIDKEAVLAPVGSLPFDLPADEYWELPHLAVDSSGIPWLFARRLCKRQPDTPPEGPFYMGLWEIYVTRYEGSRWGTPMRLPHSAGRNDMTPASAFSRDGSLWATWATDLRSTRSYLPHQLQVWIANLGASSGAAVPELVTYQPPSPSAHPIHPRERDQVRRIREYRVQNRGDTYFIYRGDLHRHTDISADGLNDGSLLDAYRYAWDAAALDFVGIADHNTGIDEPYAWWLSQKTADLFHAAGRFVTFYGYERSVEYPNGHRNVFFSRRGASITPIPPVEAAGWEGAERLHWYLRRAGGISIPHTTGRTSGTDWRDSDPEVEPVVEIYQGMRDTYEHPGAPHPKRIRGIFPDASRPVPRASSEETSPSFRPLGFVSSALAKGLRLGFISSSDHISTHVSYACVIAGELTRESLMTALRARRAYAATDNLILDARFEGSDGEHLMGEEFESSKPLRIRIRVVGTNVIQSVELISNNRVVHAVAPGREEVDVEWSDPGATPGERYYYARVIQIDGEMAWTSPVWVRYCAPGSRDP